MEIYAKGWRQQVSRWVGGWVGEWVGGWCGCYI